jgi:hypothetical protein
VDSDADDVGASFILAYGFTMTDDDEEDDEACDSWLRPRLTLEA